MHARADAFLQGLEARLDVISGEVRMLRDETAEIKGVTIRTESIVLAMAPRLRRLDRERELDREDIRAIRSEQRDSLPDFEGLSPTGRARAISQHEAEKLLADDRANAKREAEHERVKSQLEASQKQVSDLLSREAKKDEWATAWRRALIPVLVSAILGATFAYVVTRATQPRYKQTVEQK